MDNDNLDLNSEELINELFSSSDLTVEPNEELASAQEEGELNEATTEEEVPQVRQEVQATPKKPTVKKPVEAKAEKKNPQPSRGKERSIYRDVYDDLRNFGVLKHSEIGEDEDIDVEQLKTLYEQDYEKEVQNRLSQWANEVLDDEARSFIQFKRNGGSTRDFVKFMSLEENQPLSGDINDEDFQDDVIRHQLISEEYQTDEIEEVLERLTRDGKKQAYANRVYERMKREQNKKMEHYVKEQENKEALRKQHMVQFQTNISNLIRSSKEVGGFEIKNGEKQSLINFILTPSEETEDGVRITPLQKKLTEVFASPEKLVLLSKLLSQDFDMSDYKKQLITKETQRIKSNLENRQGLIRRNLGSSSASQELLDFFK